MRKAALIAAVALLLIPARRAGADEVSYVPAREYAATAEREIDGAKSSVKLCLFLLAYHGAEPDAGPARLARALVRARERGVPVDVLLNGTSEGDGLLFKNREAAEFLMAHGVAVAFSDGPLLHAKTLVVDGRTVLAGSSNWSAAAFQENGEGNLLARSETAARAAAREMDAFPRRVPPAPPAGAVPVPAAFLTADGPLFTMARNGDDKGYDAALYLLYQQARTGGPEFLLNERETAARLGFQGGDWNQVQTSLRRVLKRLRDRYGLIAMDNAFAQDPRVRITTFPAAGATALPRAYFEWGWDGRLGFPAKAFYLLGLHYAAVSPTAPAWSAGHKEMAAEHGVSTQLLQDGVSALRRAGLLDVRYGEVPSQGTGPRRPNVYELRPLYDPAELEKAFQTLEKTYGAEALARARGIAGLVYADADAPAVERLILLERLYGREIMDRAVKIIGDKQPTNPKRSIGYLIGTIQGMAGERGGGAPEDE